jgi:hypothetical protein
MASGSQSSVGGSGSSNGVDDAETVVVNAKYANETLLILQT